MKIRRWSHGGAAIYSEVRVQVESTLKGNKWEGSASINQRKDTGHKKPSVPEKEENKLPAKLDVVKETSKKKVDTVEETQETQITQEIIDIEDVSTQKDNVESVDKESGNKYL